LIAYKNSLDGLTHYALVNAENGIDSEKPVFVRVHMKNALTDAFGSQDSKAWPLQDALKQVAQAKQGVVVVLSLPDEDASILQWMWEHSGVDKDDVVKTNNRRIYELTVLVRRY